MCDDMTNALALSEKKNPLANEVAKNIFSKNKIPTLMKEAQQMAKVRDLYLTTKPHDSIFLPN